jgi:hypothetical protein
MRSISRFQLFDTQAVRRDESRLRVLATHQDVPSRSWFVEFQAVTFFAVHSTDCELVALPISASIHGLIGQMTESVRSGVGAAGNRIQGIEALSLS